MNIVEIQSYKKLIQINSILYLLICLNNSLTHFHFMGSLEFSKTPPFYLPQNSFHS